MSDNEFFLKNEEEILAGKFMFVSYSHEDKDIVRADVEKLIGMGARLWIDNRDENHKNLNIGDNWTKKVKNAITHENCQGVIFYVSPEFLASKSIYEYEYLVAMEQKDKNPEFLMYPVKIVTDESKSDYIYYYRSAGNLCEEYKEGDRYFSFLDYEKRIREEQEKIFNENTIFISRSESNPSIVIGEIGKKLKENGVIDVVAKSEIDTKRAAEELKEAMMPEVSILLGVYKASEYNEGLSGHGGKNGRFKQGDAEYIYCDGKCFYEKELVWKLLYQDGKTNTAVLIAADIVDRCSAVGTKAFLEKFRELAFNEKENGLIKNIRLFNSEDAKMLADTGVPELDSRNGYCTWWTDIKGLIEDSWQIAYKNSTQYGKGFAGNLTMGVRPVIEVDYEELMKYLNPEDKKKPEDNQNKK